MSKEPKIAMSGVKFSFFDELSYTKSPGSYIQNNVFGKYPNNMI